MPSGTIIVFGSLAKRMEAANDGILVEYVWAVGMSPKSESGTKSCPDTKPMTNRVLVSLRKSRAAIYPLQLEDQRLPKLRH